MLRSSVFSVILRGTTLLSKFLLILYLGRYLAVEELGIYGLMAVTISFSLYVLGMDFNLFNTREILAHDATEHGRLIRDQLVFHGLVYLIVLPALLGVFLAGFLPWHYAAWFYGLLVLEHLQQEAHRLLVTLSRPVLANVVLFFRSGAWAYAVVATGLLVPHARNLDLVWIGWTVGGLVGLAIAVVPLRRLGVGRAWRLPVDWQWIGRGLRNSLVFFAATLSLKAMEYADRYFLQFFHGETMVGVYTLYAQLANVVLTFIETGIVMVLLPHIIAAHQRGRDAEFQVLLRRMGLATLGASLGLGLLAAVGVFPVLWLVQKDIYWHQMNAYWIFLLSVLVITNGFMAHYWLYARRRDVALLVSAAAALVVAVIGNALLVPTYGIMGAAVSTLIAATCLSGTKFLLVWRGRLPKRSAAI